MNAIHIKYISFLNPKKKPQQTKKNYLKMKSWKVTYAQITLEYETCHNLKS